MLLTSRQTAPLPQSVLPWGFPTKILNALLFSPYVLRAPNIFAILRVGSYRILRLRDWQTVFSISEWRAAAIFRVKMEE